MTFDSKQLLSLQTNAVILGLAVLLNYGVTNEKLRCLNAHETNYGIPDLEALALIWAIKRIPQYLLGCHFWIMIDLHSLCNLKKM